VIFRREVLAILARQVFVLSLGRQSRRMLFVRGYLFRRRWTRRYATFSTIECRVIFVYYDGPVVDVSHIGDAHVGHRTVVEDSPPTKPTPP
jgi:hypothetical protein